MVVISHIFFRVTQIQDNIIQLALIRSLKSFPHISNPIRNIPIAPN